MLLRLLGKPFKHRRPLFGNRRPKFTIVRRLLAGRRRTDTQGESEALDADAVASKVTGRNRGEVPLKCEP